MPDPRYAASKEVAKANRAFYRAFEQLDIAAMTALWLDDDSIRCVHPGCDLLVGRERVLGSWLAIFGSTDAIRFELADLSIEITGECAWATNVERIRTTLRGAEHVSEAIATNLYVLRDAQWRLALHHASPIARRFPA
jgi:ketosteroid isomerase-like protein